MAVASAIFYLALCGVSAAQPASQSMRMDSGLDQDRQPAPMFKLREVHRAPSAPKQSEQPGVVGLDLLITTMDFPLVQGVFPQTSAEREGIRSGDRLVQINGQSTLGQSRSQVDGMISDHIGDRVHLLILREHRLKTVTLTVSPAPDRWN